MAAKSGTVSVRELQQNLKRVLRTVERGRGLEITRRGKPVARLVPLEREGPVEPWPDLAARRRAIFGDRVFDPPLSQTILDDRD